MRATHSLYSQILLKQGYLTKAFLLGELSSSQYEMLYTPLFEYIHVRKRWFVGTIKISLLILLFHSYPMESLSNKRAYSYHRKRAIVRMRVEMRYKRCYNSIDA